MIETVNDPICSYYKLANGFIGKLRYNPSPLGKAAKVLVCRINNLPKRKAWLELSIEMYRTVSSMSARAERESLT